MPSKRLSPSPDSFSNPWILLGILVAANSLLSFGHLPLVAQWGIGLLGIALPCLAVLWKSQGAPLSSLGHQTDFLEGTPPWVFGLLAVIAISVRFIQLTTLSTWPLIDEGLFGYLATRASEHWEWTLFHTESQAPPLFVWGLGTVFKLLGPSLTALWLWPAFLSALSLPLAYAASKAFGSRSFAAAFTCLWAFNFGSLFIGRLCLGHSLEILFQFGSFAILGAWLNLGPGKKRLAAAFGLGLLAGGGFFTLLHWAMMAAFLGLAVLWLLWRDARDRWRLGAAFGLPFGLLAGAFLFLFLNTGHGTYLQSISILHRGFAWKEQAVLIGQYFSSFFWGVTTPRFAYKPFWGGFLDPLTSSLFFMGLVQILRRLPGFVSLGALGTFLLFGMPAFLSNDPEFLRTLLDWPLLLAGAALGISTLGRGPFRHPAWAPMILLSFCAGLGLYHLEGPYRSAWRSNDQATLLDVKSLERYRAYQILDSVSRAQGPGLVLTELDPGPYDQTFATAVYPFNIARNPRLQGIEPGWAALVTNLHYGPFLVLQFPQARWFPLASESASPQGTLLLGLFPWNSKTQPFLHRWLTADQALHPLTDLTFNNSIQGPSQPPLERLLALEPSMEKDPLLMSCLTERIFLAALASSRGATALPILQKALKTGYPGANLWNDLGILWWNLGDREKARQAFAAAHQAPIDHTPARYNFSRTW